MCVSYLCPFFFSFDLFSIQDILWLSITMQLLDNLEKDLKMVSL